MATDIINQEALAPPSMMQEAPSPTSSMTPLPTPNSTSFPQDSVSPSPSTPANGNKNHSQSSASRRPPRKSTLTQQQKNQKRQRATQDQLTTLEMEFNKNPTPTATVRERIAEEINMTERSVQIWFQNRRAKIKLLAKKSLESGEDMDSIPESMRQYLAMQAMESGKGLGYFGRTGLLPYGHQGMLGGEQGGQGKVLIHHLTCKSLTIGKWMRVSQNSMDLIIFYSPDKCTMTYYINNEQEGYKIEYPFSYIKNIYLNNGDGDHMGGITIELLSPPLFFMDAAGQASGFFQVGDFTEDQQASSVLTHHLGGNPKILSGQLAKLVSLEAFMHRHSPNHMFQEMHHPMALSAPVSPARPSSQPNFAQPHVGMFQENQWGINVHQNNNMMMRGGPGHKRQRSRSVPGPIDFQTLQMLQQPPSFHITQPEHHQAPVHNPQIFAPIPQQPNMLGPLNPNLRIDTQAGFGSLDMRQYPMSATTAPHSPAGFNSPNYFAPPDNGNMAGSFTPYSATFSPMINPSSFGVPPPSISPLSFDHPAIMSESPPMSMPPICEGSAISDDGSNHDMYQPGKHSYTLPMHPHSPFAEPNQAEMELNQYMDLKHFDVDPASLSPESIHHTQ
ncbi:Transcription elongation factor SPT4 [Neurospora sp. IMI 360204]|nr:Transcription elongation factor SPT4 [Neurospora sp. IMI 360204]